MPALLEIRNLRKQFKSLEAVRGISFQIPKGICFGLLGPNGAGKTTTIEMIEGITSPTSGEIFYKGQSLDSEENRQQFKNEAGIQFQSTSLMDYLTVQEVLELFAKLYPHPQPIATLVQQCYLQDFLQQPAAKLSGGQRQRLLLAIALINDPDILFLDEPTTGLDPQSRRNFWNLIDSIKQQGKTIILTTHYMDEAQQLCDQLVIVDRGQIIAQGSPEQLLQQHFDHTLVCLKQQDLPTKPALTANIHYQGELAMIESQEVEATLEQLIQKGVSLTSLQIRKPTLDDLFLKLTGHKLRQ